VTTVRGGPHPAAELQSEDTEAADTPRRSRFAVAAPWISTVVRLALGGVLLAAGGLKVVDPQSSVQAVRAFELVPTALETWVGWGVPFLEIALGLLLVAGLFTRVVAAAASALLVVFIVAVASAAARGLSIDCGCFGGGGPVAPGEASYTGELLRDFGFLALGLWLVARPESRCALDARDPEEGE